MEFRAEFFPKPFQLKIKYDQQLFLIGSCFTEQIGVKLQWHKFHVLENPTGILFNPVSILKSLQSCFLNRQYKKEDLFNYNGVWSSWDHHTRFSSVDQQEAIHKINASIADAAQFLKSTEWIFITLGSAFVYERKEVEPDDSYHQVVANCHKVPADSFNRRLMKSDEVELVLSRMISLIRQFQPDAKIVFTISPVRHLREGFIENNRSKSSLIQAVHAVTDEKHVFYFPAYELVIDDLRDYRFYAEDLVHPNYAATNYVWEKFTDACIDKMTLQTMKEVSSVMHAYNHKPFNPTSIQHKQFIKNNLTQIETLRKKHPYLNFEKETAYFESVLKE